jgi:AcrR family transcriptional regulator
MAVRLTRTEQTERNRGLVLDAARTVFLDRGYAGASLDAIADEAGFTKGVVYSQFAGKADLFLALLDRRIEERAAWNAEAATTLAGAEGLRELLVANRRREQDDAGWMRLLMEFRLVAARDEELNARYAAAHERTVERFGSALQAIAERGGLRLIYGPRDTAVLVLALAAGITLERAAAPDVLADHIPEDLLGRLAEPI